MKEHIVPEVGDVFEDAYRKTEAIIIEKEDNYTLYLNHYIGKNTTYFMENCFDDEYFLSTHKYLGKSKINIFELFEVQDY